MHKTPGTTPEIWESLLCLGRDQFQKVWYVVRRAAGGDHNEYLYDDMHWSRYAMERVARDVTYKAWHVSRDFAERVLSRHLAAQPFTPRAPVCP